MSRTWDDMMASRRVYAKREAILLQKYAADLYRASRILRQTGDDQAYALVSQGAASYATCARECVRTILGIRGDET